MADNDSSTSSANSESETIFLDFSTLKTFNMELSKKKSAIKSIHNTNVNPKIF